MAEAIYLGGSIVKDGRLGHVGIDGADVNNGTATCHVLYTLLGHAEVSKDVCLEGELQAVPCELPEVIHLRALVGCIVDQNVDLAPFLDCLVNNLPAQVHGLAVNTMHLASFYGGDRCLEAFDSILSLKCVHRSKQNILCSDCP